jgi:hypothetical protein
MTLHPSSAFLFLEAFFPDLKTKSNEEQWYFCTNWVMWNLLPEKNIF